MTPALIIIMLLCAWLAVALAMLWGMLRLTRRPRSYRAKAPKVQRKSVAAR